MTYNPGSVLNGKPAYPVAWSDDERALKHKTIRKGW
jgi:hypothetical protein